MKPIIYPPVFLSVKSKLQHQRKKISSIINPCFSHISWHWRKPLLPFALMLMFMQSAIITHAQQTGWLKSWPMDYLHNPYLPDQVLVSTGDLLAGMRLNETNDNFNLSVYGNVSIHRLDPATGTQIWSCELTGSVAPGSAAIDAEGRAYFSGKFIGQPLVICDGTQLPGSGDPFQVRYFLISVDMHSGELLWARDLYPAHSAANDIPSLAIDPDGKLWYAVEEWGQGKIVMVDSQGNDVETRTIQGVRRIGTISFDPWGGLYVSGSTDDAGLTFGGQTHQVAPATGYNMFVLRYRPNSSAGFVAFATDETFHNPTVVATQDGYAYLAGDLMTATSWGDITFNGPDWVSSVFVAMLDSTGHFLWGVESKSIAGGISGDARRAKGVCITTDDNNQAYFMANVRGQVDWGNGVVSGSTSVTLHAMTIVAISAAGFPQWQMSSEATGNFINAQAITSFTHSKVYFAGQLTSSFTFPPYTTNVMGNQAAMTGSLNLLPANIPEAIASPELMISPNPATSLIDIYIRTDQPTEGQLRNSNGQVVKKILLRNGKNSVSLAEITPGFYYLHLTNGQRAKLIIK
jgi:hypothetical protein